jgi:hypothetical protein
VNHVVVQPADFCGGVNHYVFDRGSRYSAFVVRAVYFFFPAGNLLCLYIVQII